MKERMPTEEYNILEKRLDTLEQDIKESFIRYGAKQDEMIEVLTDIRIDLQKLNQVPKNEKKINELEKKIDEQEAFYNKLIGAVIILSFIIPILVKYFT